jgi:ketosteroid isomerase-like protein
MSRGHDPGTRIRLDAAWEFWRRSLDRLERYLREEQPGTPARIGRQRRSRQRGIGMADTRGTDEAAIRGIVEAWRQALRAKDAQAMLAHYDSGVLSYDLAPPLLTRGPDIAGTQAWLATWDGPIESEIRDLRVELGGDLAMVTSVNRMIGTKTDGEQVDLWVRVTLGLRRTDGRWRVIHEHVSVPFYMDGSLKAAVDLQP